MGRTGQEGNEGEKVTHTIRIGWWLGNGVESRYVETEFDLTEHEAKMAYAEAVLAVLELLRQKENKQPLDNEFETR